MSLKPAFVVIAYILVLFLSVCCRTGSLLTVTPPGGQREYAPKSVLITCHFDSCPDLVWMGPAIGSRRTTTTRNPRESVLTINNLMEQDEGDYHCVCNGAASASSHLTVFHFPNFDRVPLNQTLHRGETSPIRCPADPGDPPLDMLWIRNGNAILGSNRRRLDATSQTLVIEDISDSDSGIYKCGFNTMIGFRSVDIQVNVVVPPPSIPRIIIINNNNSNGNILGRNVTIRYGQPLNLTCKTRPVDSTLQFSWIFDEHRRTNQTLLLQPERVIPGFYRCLVYSLATNIEVQHSVFVSVSETPPIPALPGVTIPAETIEFGQLSLHVDFRFLLDPNDLTFQWKRGQGMAINFSPRFSYNVSRKRLRMTIENAQLRDRGTYKLNISNQYGYTVLPVSLSVTKLKRTNIETTFTDLPCGVVQAQRSQIVSQIEREFSCQTCGDVSVLDAVIGCALVGSNSNQGVTSLRLTLLSQDALTLPQQVTVTIGDTNVIGEVCPGSCPVTTNATPAPGVKTNATNQVVYIVVALILIFVILVVILLTFFIRMCHKHYCNKHKVAQEEEHNGQHPVVIVQQDPPANQNQAECIGYVRVKRAEAYLQGAPTSSVTPITAPFPGPPSPPPPHIAAAPPPMAGVGLGRATGPGRAKRPEKLFFRSHSYHGTTRTPLA